MPIGSEKPFRPGLPFLDRLTTKIAIAAAVFLFALTAATAVLVQTGFRRNQFGAYSSSQSVLEAQARKALVQSAAADVQRLEAGLQEEILLVRHAAGMLETALSEEGAALPEEAVGMFEGLLAQHPHLTALVYQGTDGEVILASRPGAASPTGAAPDFAVFQPESKEAAAARPAAWSLAGEAGERSLTLSLPVYAAGRLRGALSAWLPLASLREQLLALAGQAGGQAWIVDEEGNLVASSGEGLPESALAGPEAGVSAGDGGAQGQMIDQDGEQRLLVSLLLQEGGWRVLISYPAGEIERQSRSTANAVWQDAEQTIRSTLVMVFLLFLAALLAGSAAILFNALLWTASSHVPGSIRGTLSCKPCSCLPWWGSCSAMLRSARAGCCCSGSSWPP